MKFPLLLIAALAASIDAGANRATRRPQKKVATDDHFVSISDAAAYLAVDPMTVRNMLKDGRLRAWTLGPRVVRIKLSDLDAALQPYGGGNVT
ncbi:excisionase family DNA-binding protein [Mycobacterium numidiamassiliense]|uniref:excisionase family DNA-binding protein n=1 Tax=Mycobacterium numidiamassiliense TaxID=1841861 RepID=UPI001FEA4807|nr:excisionase family DNA-binding protein [Mycobacterium numidiamassiliense]